MKVLVAGGTGFIGSAIVDALLYADFEVGILSRSRPSNPRTTWVRADVTDPQGLDLKLRGWDVLVDAVQFPNSPIENPRRGNTFERVDYGGTRSLIDAAKPAGVRHFVLISGVNAEQDAPYHWLRFKWLEEQHLVQSGLPYTAFRPSWVYGPGDVSLNRFLGFARFLPFIPIIGNGKTRIAPVFVNDVAAHVVAASGRGPKSAIFELGGPEVLTMDDVVKRALQVSGKKRFLFHQPVWLMKAVATVARLLPGPPLTPDAIDFITMDGLTNNTPVEEAFGLPLTPLEDGLRSYLT